MTTLTHLWLDVFWNLVEALPVKSGGSIDASGFGCVVSLFLKIELLK